MNSVITPQLIVILPSGNGLNLLLCYDSKLFCDAFQNLLSVIVILFAFPVLSGNLTV